jgi:hypothetical protein
MLASNAAMAESANVLRIRRLQAAREHNISEADLIDLVDTLQMRDEHHLNKLLFPDMASYVGALSAAAIGGSSAEGNLNVVPFHSGAYRKQLARAGLPLHDRRTRLHASFATLCQGLIAKLS